MATQFQRMCLLTAAVVLPVVSTGCRFVLVANDDQGVFCLEGEDGELKIDIRANDQIRPSDMEVEFVGPVFVAGEDLLAASSYNAETGQFCFTPAEGADGIVCFTYSWQYVEPPPEDAHVRSEEGKVTLLIRGVDAVPNAVSDEATTEQGESVKIDVLTNDSWSEGSQTRIGLEIQSVEVAEGDGTAEIVRRGGPWHHHHDNDGDEDEDGDDHSNHHGRQCIRYTPPSEDFVGQVAFSYTIVDECGKTATAQVTVDVVADEPEPEPEPEPQPEPAPTPEPTPGPAPPVGTATVIFNNDSDQEATFTVDGGEPVVLGPFTSSPPVDVPAGTNLEVRVECPPAGELDPVIKTTANCDLVSEVSYTIRFFVDGDPTVECTETTE